MVKNETAEQRDIKRTYMYFPEIMIIFANETDYGTGNKHRRPAE